MEKLFLTRPKKKYYKLSDRTDEHGNPILTKTQMHKELRIDWLLPESNTKGCTKEYLIKVSQGLVYRVQKREILSYLVQEDSI